MTVPLQKAQADLAALIACVERGETVTIERDGAAVAHLVAITPLAPQERELGIWEGAWQVSEDAFSPETEAEIERLFYGE